MSHSLQHLAFPDLRCYGCGPANPDGLHLESSWSADGDAVVSTFQPAAKFTSGLAGALYGGLIASLVDCHSNWTAMAFATRAEGRRMGEPPPVATVTGTLGVRFLKPTPMGEPLHLRAWVDGEIGRKLRVICELGPAGDVTAIGDSIFVRVDPAMLR